MRISEKQYQEIALRERDEQWELDCGRLRSKPSMTYEHNHVSRVLGFSLQSQLGFENFEVSVNEGRARRSSEKYYIPDVMVIPRAYTLPLRGRRDVLEAYRDPLPLVVEVWSPSTGSYDARSKLPEYQQRGDLEIWFIHPYERTLTAWRRQPDGSYSETLFDGGTIQPVALAGVTIDLDALLTS